ncbi:MAG: DMT family transporter [Vulcanisaeta sp. AZ3]
MKRDLFVGYLITYVISASINYFFVKFGLKYSPPLGYMALRTLLAGIVLGIVSLVMNNKYFLIMNKDFLLLSLFASLSTALWAYGLVYVDPGSSAIFSYTMPLFAILLSVVILHERPRIMSIIGTVIGFIGVTIYGISSIARGVPLIGALLTIANSIFWALYSIYFRKLGNYDGIIVVSNMFIVNAVILTLMGFLVNGMHVFEISWTQSFILNLLGTALIGGSTLFLVWYFMINTLGVSNVMPYIFIVPAFTLLLNYLILGMEPTIPELIGSAIMFLGIYLSTT